MKKKKKVVKKWEREDEILDLKELMDVEGGVEKNEGLKTCNLGCYNGINKEIEPNDDKIEDHEA